MESARREAGIDDSLVVLTHAPVQPGDASESLNAATEAMGDREARARVGWSSLRNQGGRYVSALMWVVRDALPRYTSQVAAIVVCNILGLAAAAGAVGGVMAYARAAEHDRPMRILGHAWRIGSDVRSLLLFGAAIATLGIVSAGCTYVVDRLILALARRYHAFCADRAIAIAADPLCRGWQVMLDDPPRSILSRMAGGSSRVMGLVLRDLLRIILPSLTVIAVVAFLFYIDATLTLVLIPATAAYLLPLYAINRRVTRMQREYRDLSPQARSEVGRRLREALQSGQLEQEFESIRRDALHGSAYRGTLAALYGRLLADRRVHLLNAAFFIVCLVALLIFFGIQARDHARPWSDLIFYLLALRYAMTSLKQTTTLGAKFSRFFPEYHAYSEFVVGSARTRERRSLERAKPRELPDQLSLRLGKSGRWNSPRMFRIRLPGTVIVLSPLASGHADLEAMMLRFERRVDEDVDLTTSAAFIANGDGPEEAALGSAPAVALSGPMAARQRTPAALAPILRSNGRLVFIVHDDPASLDTWPLSASIADAKVLVSDGMRFVAAGDRTWLRDNVAEISAFLEESAERYMRRGGGEDGVDDDEDEDAE